MDIPGYQIVRQLGQGGMAAVYLAVQDTLNRQVALKVINPELTDVGFRERFAREGRIVARLRHPQIITVYDFWTHESTLLLSMEYLPGGSLKERIERRLPKLRVLEIAALIADALAYAHRNGVVHRDIKPANILFREDDTPILTDFGIACLLDESSRLTRPGISIGSPGYMSPEQMMGQVIDFRSDIYSLGIVFYEMLTGDVPWSDAGHPITAALEHCKASIPRFPAELTEYQPILEKLLAKEPKNRYQDVGTFAEDLRRLARDDGAPQELEPTRRRIVRPQDRVPEPRRRTWHKPAIATFVLLAVVGLGIGAYLLFGNLLHQDDAETLLPIALPPAAGDRPIAQLDEALTIELLHSQNYEQSLVQIRGGLKRSPKDERLLALKDIVETRWTANRHLKAASDQFDSGNLDSAAQEIKEGLNVMESHPQLLALRDEIVTALHKLAERNFAAGDFESSRVRIGQGLWLMPDHPALLALRDRVDQRIANLAKADELLTEATRLEGEKRWQEALSGIEQAMDLAPDRTELVAARGRVEKGLLRFKAAEADRLYTQAKNLLNKGELASSQQLIRNGLELVPDHPHLQALRGEVQEAIRRRETATGLLAKARNSYADGDYRGSSALLDEGLRLVPNHPELLKWKKRVGAEMEQEYLRQAQSLYRQATALKSEGKLEEAIALTKRGLTLAPKDSDLRALETEIHRELNRLAERERKVQSLLGDARARLDAGALEDAAAAARKALELTPEHPQAKDLLADAERRFAQREAQGKARELLSWARQDFEADRLDEARSLVKSGLELAPNDKELAALQAAIDNRIELGRKSVELVALAEEKADTGALEETLSALEQVLQLDPNDRHAQDLRDQVYADLENRQAATKLLAEAQELREEGKLEKSLAVIDAGLNLIPDYPPLVALRTEIQQTLSAEQQRKADAQPAD